MMFQKLLLRNLYHDCLHAYETKVYGTITSGSDCDRLQQALTNLDLWSQDNNIKFDLSYLCIIWDAKENSNIL